MRLPLRFPQPLIFSLVLQLHLDSVILIYHALGVDLIEAGVVECLVLGFGGIGWTLGAVRGALVLLVPVADALNA